MTGPPLYPAESASHPVEPPSGCVHEEMLRRSLRHLRCRLRGSACLELYGLASRDAGDAGADRSFEKP